MQRREHDRDRVVRPGIDVEDDLHAASLLCEHVFVSILHADADAFFASVEQRDDPSLRGRPVIVGGGVVLAASYEAKAHGVRTAMGGRQALQLCPSAAVVRPRMSAYTEASRALYAVFEEHSPVVEGLSIDEAFLDARGWDAIEIATRVRREARERVGIPVTVGIARTKFLAKVASGVAKPDGLLLVPPDRELAFLHPLPVERVWGVGAVTAAKLRSWDIATVGQLAASDLPALELLLGRAAARHLHALANNRDPRVVRPRRRRRSVGAQHALGRRPRSAEELDADLIALVERVTRRMRDAHRVGRTVTLRMRFADFRRATRSRSLRHATAQTSVVLDACRWLLAESSPLIAQRGLTLIGVAVSNLQDDLPMQLSLDADDAAILDAALDEIRARFGAKAVTRGVLLGRSTLEMPLLPE
jgi:DNA polymerase-4